MTKSLKIVLSGIQPTGHIHLGNYLGAIQNWVKLQNDQSYKRFYTIVDLHSLTQRFQMSQNPSSEEIVDTHNASLVTGATLLACGVDPKKSTLFIQSHVQYHSELHWLLSCITPANWLNKMVQFKEKSQQSNGFYSLGLYTYPILMTADILCYKASVVPVGSDQIQHIELARDITIRFNNLIGKQFFPLPSAMNTDESLWVSEKVMSLQNPLKKMSKSDQNQLSCINITDGCQQIRDKIKMAKTDSDRKITLDDERQGVQNLLKIYGAMIGIRPKDIALKYVDKDIVQFKLDLANLLVDRICPIGDQSQNLLHNRKDLLLEALHHGSLNASNHAGETMRDIKTILKIRAITNRKPKQTKQDFCY